MLLSTFVPKKEREPIKEILQKKLSEYEERKMKDMISSSDKYCLDEKFPCKLSKKEMCEKHAAHPDDDGKKVKKLEQNEKHGLWGLMGRYRKPTGDRPTGGTHRPK